MRVFPILFVALTDARTALLASGLIARLKLEIPHADITLIATPEAALLYKDDPRITRIQVFNEPVFSVSGMKAALGLGRRTYGLMVDVGPSDLSRAPIRGWIRARTAAIMKPSSLIHPAQRMAGLLRLDEPVTPNLVVSDARLEEARAFFADNQAENPLLVMAPGASWLGRQWPAERFTAVARRLLSEEGPLKDARLLIIGGDEDRAAAEAVRMSAPRTQVMQLTGRLDLLTAFAALKDATAFVGNEGIWLHLAAAAGIPAFGLYGPNDESLEAPLGEHVHIVRGPRSLKQIKTQDPRLDQEVCHLLDLSVNQVCEAITRAMRPSPKPVIDVQDEPALIFDLVPPRPEAATQKPLQVASKRLMA